MLIKNVTATATGLIVLWADQSTMTFSWFWLMDHSNDPQSVNSQTLQRNVDTFSIPLDIAADSAQLDAAATLVQINWPNQQITTISCLRLCQVAGKTLDDEQLSETGSKTFWLADNMPETLPSISYHEVMQSEQGVLNWLENIDTYGFSIVTQTVATEQATIALAERIAAAQTTIFGTYWPLSSEVKHHDDSAYTTDFLAPHTDACYYYNAAGLQMFNCMEFDGSGGESVLVDGFAIARRIQAERPDLYEILSRVAVPGHYKETAVHLAAERPTFRLDRRGELEQVSFNNYDRSPFILEAGEQSQFYQAYAEFNRHSMNQDNWIKIALRPGTALIFNNWRCLHGRMGYSGKRNFFGCYHDRADYQSRMRTLQQTLSL
ncbi:MAG: TauD/TfdA family dioxygenase [Pseudomonadales bacterium]|nr:TauD/TfdA family dioxygenase [Pseudomonadales bacterium]NRA14217.1 TauD/TfdA family dioxygenase [Oceanospirillaceae bacterium]